MTNDTFPSLNDALEFLGWCESDVGRNDVLPENVDDMLNGAVKNAVVMSLWKQQPISNRPPKKKTYFRNPSCSSTTLQRKKKAAIQMLREQAVELKGYLKQLKKRRGGLNRDFSLGSGDQNGELSSWYQRSVIEYQERLRSEQTNKRLIEILDHQKKINSELKNLFKRQRVYHVRILLFVVKRLRLINVLRGDQQGKTFVEKIEQPSREISVDFSSLLLSQLENQVGNLYWEFKTSFRPQEPFQLYCASQAKYDEELKSLIVEFTTTTPLDCSGEDACEGIWGVIREHTNPASKANSLQTRTSMALQHKQCVLYFEWFYCVHKTVVDGQIVIVWSDAVLLPSQKLQYGTHGCTVVTATETGCVVCTKVKLYRERNGENLAKESATMKQAHDMAFGALSIKIRRLCLAEQNRLIQQSLG